MRGNLQSSYGSKHVHASHSKMNGLLPLKRAFFDQKNARFTPSRLG